MVNSMMRLSSSVVRLGNSSPKRPRYSTMVLVASCRASAAASGVRPPDRSRTNVRECELGASSGRSNPMSPVR
ncbi:hypothetical protein ACFFX0_03335 [Citricoccus parietis]|uniref:Secreted protein n=1 Tax=Citricoccus parietis TaxID=592307 RepID=A0ABV5FUE9_9MICC